MKVLLGCAARRHVQTRSYRCCGNMNGVIEGLLKVYEPRRIQVGKLTHTYPLLTTMLIL